MPIALLLLLVSPLIHHFQLSSLGFWQSLSTEPHEWCLSHSPTPSAWEKHYAAMVCGEPLKPDLHRRLLEESGLLHLIVVSGSHLVFLERWLRLFSGRSQAASWLVLGALFYYCLICHWSPPAVRAWVSIGLAHIAQRRKWFWSRNLHSLLTGLFCLALMPEWWRSLSFLLSWLASWLHSLPIKRPLHRQTLLFLGLFLPLSLLNAPHPRSILLNLLIGPSLGTLLFPISLLTFIFPALTRLGDPVWHSLYFLLAWLVPTEKAGANPLAPIATGPFILWLYAGSLIIAAILGAILWKRFPKR